MGARMLLFFIQMQVTKLIGPPPGSTGYGLGGFLAQKLKKYPNAVVLFEEVREHCPSLTESIVLHCPFAFFRSNSIIHSSGIWQEYCE